MSDSKIISRSEALQLKKVITVVSGIFDLLHLGHMRMLVQAKNINPKAKLLVMVLNDTDSKERKGLDRPIFKLQERCEALSYLGCVDYIIPWYEHWQELRNFIIELRPEILAVVNGDSGIENKRLHIETAGGRLVELQRNGNYSTTSIIKSIKEL